MNTVTVRASKQYDILIGSGLLPTLGAEAKKLGKARTVCLVSESTVYPLYGKAAEDSLKSAGFSVVSYVFPAGESSKNGTVRDERGLTSITYTFSSGSTINCML